MNGFTQLRDLWQTPTADSASIRHEIPITDIRPLRIGQTENREAGTGCTVFLCESGMRAGLENGYFEQLLRELVCESTHCGEVELVPVEEGSAAEETAELAAIKAGMSAEELDAVRAEVVALREEQERPDAPEDLAKLPRLTVADIGDAPAETPLKEVAAPLPCLYHALDTHHIAYVYHYFDLRRVAYDDLPYVTLITSLLSQLDTKSHTAAELDTHVEGNLGGLSFFTEAIGREDDLSFARPMLVVGASALSEKIGELATIPSEIWGETLFEDTDRMRDILTQRRIGMEQLFVGSGHSAAMARLSSYFSARALVSDMIGGVDFYLFLKDLLANWDERAKGLCASSSSPSPPSRTRRSSSPPTSAS